MHFGCCREHAPLVVIVQNDQKNWSSLFNQSERTVLQSSSSISFRLNVRNFLPLFLLLKNNKKNNNQPTNLDFERSLQRNWMRSSFSQNKHLLMVLLVQHFCDIAARCMSRRDRALQVQGKTLFIPHQNEKTTITHTHNVKPEARQLLLRAQTAPRRALRDFAQTKQR